MEPRIFIYNLFESWDPYVRSKYNTISERYQGAEKYMFYYRKRLFITFNSTVVNPHVILNMFQLYAYIFTLHFFSNPQIPNFYKNHWLSFAQIIDTTCVPLLAALVSLCTIGMIKDNWDLTSSWCWIGYLTNLFHGSRIMLKNGSVLGTNI